MIVSTSDSLNKTAISAANCANGHNKGKVLIQITSKDEDAGIYLSINELEKHIENLQAIRANHYSLFSE